MSEGVVAFEESGRERSLASQDDAGCWAEREAKDRRGNGKERGAMESCSQCAGQFGICRGVGGCCVEGAFHVGVRERTSIERDEVVEVDPGERLSSRTEDAAQAETEDGKHSFESSSTPTEDHPDTQCGDPCAELSCRQQGLLPRDTERGEKVVRWGRSLGALFFRVSVIAHRAGPDDDARGRWTLLHRLHQACTHSDAAFLEASLLGGVPACAKQVFSREMYDGITVFHGCDEVRVVFTSLDEGGLREERARLRRRAGPDDEGMIVCVEALGERSSDKSSGPGHEYAHRFSVVERLIRRHGMRGSEACSRDASLKGSDMWDGGTKNGPRKGAHQGWAILDLNQ